MSGRGKEYEREKPRGASSISNEIESCVTSLLLFLKQLPGY